MPSRVHFLMLGVGLVGALLVGIRAFSADQAANASPGPEPGLVASIGVPLTGSKTTFRFEVANRAKGALAVDSPFANTTRLLVTPPDGKTRELFKWKEGLVPVELKPGESQSWD